MLSVRNGDIPIVVYHVAAMNHWQDVVREQLMHFAASGLAAHLIALDEAISVTYVGPLPGMQVLLDISAECGVPIRIVRFDENIMHYETFAMLEIERLAKTTDRHILYFHTKGVSAGPACQNKTDWRRVMARYTISMWRENVAILNGGNYDAVGWNWHCHGEQHFSGTFWIARADWIRKLPDFVAYHHAKNLVRYSCEMWIGAHSYCRAYSRGVSGHITWVGPYDYSPHFEQSQ